MQWSIFEEGMGGLFLIIFLGFIGAVAYNMVEMYGIVGILTGHMMSIYFLVAVIGLIARPLSKPHGYYLTDKEG